MHRQRSGQKGGVCKGPGAGGVAVYSGNQKKNNQGSLSSLMVGSQETGKVRRGLTTQCLMGCVMDFNLTLKSH